MSDLIDRQQAIDAIDKEQKEIDVSDVSEMYAYSKCKTIIKQLPSALGTNLAEVGTDTISRQAAINKILGQPPEPHYPSWYAEQIKELPSEEPQIIYCKDCKHRDKYGCCKHWKGLAMGDIPITTDDYDFCSNAER